MSYYYQKIIPSEVIADIEKLLSEGKKYREIKEIYKVSDGTISKIKHGKIKSNRAIENRTELIPTSEFLKLKDQLDELRNEKVDIFNSIDLLEFNKSNFDKFIKTKFGRKVFNLLKSEISKKAVKLQNENKELKRRIKELECSEKSSEKIRNVSAFTKINNQ